MLFEDSPPILSLALIILLTKHGWTQRKLAIAAGIPPTKISEYLKGDPPLTRRRLDELAAVMGLSPSRVDLAILAARVACLELPLRVSVVDPSVKQCPLVERSAAVGLQDFIEPLVERLVAEVQAVNTRQALQMGKILWKRLETEPEATRRSLVESRAAYHQWPLCLFLCDESEKKAADDAGEARKLAELALIVAQRLRHTDPGNERFYVRLEGRAEAVLGNALRVLGHLDSAESAFGRAWTLWAEGIDEAHLLSEAQMLNLEASLHRARRRFAQALRRHTEALEVARPEEVASILLNKAMTLEVQGDHASALADLARAEPLIDAESPPRLRWVLKQNKALNLVRLGRAEEAQPVVAEARHLAEQLGNGLDLTRAAWMGALADAGLGRREAAIETLETVCSDFDENGYAFDYALAGLDLALLYRADGRWAEIRVLAERMVDIFRERKIHRETIAAVLLFQEAAKREAVSAELVRRLQDYLKRAREQPGLRFEP